MPARVHAEHRDADQQRREQESLEGPGVPSHQARKSKIQANPATWGGEW